MGCVPVCAGPRHPGAGGGCPRPANPVLTSLPSTARPGPPRRSPSRSSAGRSHMAHEGTARGEWGVLHFPPLVLTSPAGLPSSVHNITGDHDGAH